MTSHDHIEKSTGLKFLFGETVFYTEALNVSHLTDDLL